MEQHFTQDQIKYTDLQHEREMYLQRIRTIDKQLAELELIPKIDLHYNATKELEKPIRGRRSSLMIYEDAGDWQMPDHMKRFTGFTGMGTLTDRSVELLPQGPMGVNGDPNGSILGETGPVGINTGVGKEGISGSAGPNSNLNQKKNRKGGNNRKKTKGRS